MIVDSVSLKEFLYHFYRLPLNDTVTSIIKLCAPNLKDIDCRSFLTQDFSLENSSPLSGVNFNMFLKEEKGEGENADAYSKLPSEEKETYAKRMMKFLGAVHMVNDMILSPGFLESNLADVGDDWEAGLSLPGMLSHLKYVQIEEVILDFRSCVGSPDRLIQIEQFKDKLRAVPTASSITGYYLTVAYVGVGIAHPDTV
ncbi:hypothetical protein C5167_031083 [Papaver somniferum]|nr:hypothetical protein C5167_031083 [Papaver somniferum]